MSVIGIVVHILGLLFFMVAFEHGLGWVIAAALIAGAGMGLLSPALTVVVQNYGSQGANGAIGNRDMAGQAVQVTVERHGQRPRYNFAALAGANFPAGWGHAREGGRAPKSGISAGGAEGSERT